MMLQTVIGEARERLLAKAKREGLATITSDSIHNSFLPAGNAVVDRIAWSAWASIWSWRSLVANAFCQACRFFES